MPSHDSGKYNIDTSKICVLIPSRYDSSRLPGKPLKKIGDYTIIQRTYLQTLKSKFLDKSRVYVVTDDNRISDNIKEIGGSVLMMSEECLNGTERICKVLNQIDNNFEIIVNVQGDEPFIDPNNIDYVIIKYFESIDNPKMVCTTIHSEITHYEDLHNRSIGKMILDCDNNVLYCSRAMIPHTKHGNMDSQTKYYAHIGIFVFKRSYLYEYLKSENTPAQLAEDIEWLKILEMGYTIKSYCVDTSEIGINTQDDFNYLAKKYLGGL